MCSTLRKPISAPRCLRIGGDLQQCRGAGAEQEIVNDLLVLQRQPREFMRKREDHMEVADGQQFFAALRQPVVAGVGLALRTMPVAAGVVRDGRAVAAPGTTVQMSAERRRAAVLDGVQNPQMQPRQPGPVLLDEAVAVLPNDIGHLEGWPVHFFFCSFRERFTWSGAETFDLSSGIADCR